MPRQAAGLSAVKVKTAKPGRYGDGNGLYLFVRTPEARFWLFRYTLPGQKMREMGLGRAGSDQAAVPLAEARTRAAELMKLVRDGIDPLAKREADAAAEKAALELAKQRSRTFADTVDAFLEARNAGWKNAKHKAQWRMTLETYAGPHLGNVAVADIKTDHVLAALTPIWTTKTETASRLRGRIEQVLDYAKARGWRSGENPAQWKGHLALTLPAPGKVAKVKHHAALPWAEVSNFMVAIAKQEGMSAIALKFAILTASRAKEVLEAQWSEFDMAAKIWTVPGGRMKGGRLHRVPLSGAAMAVLTEMLALRPGNDEGTAFVFPGLRPNKPLSNMAMLMVLRRMKRGDIIGHITQHGFRSTFRDWAGETTDTPREVSEAAIAHKVESKTEAAYARGDLFEKRRVLMDRWAQYCMAPAPQASNVVAIRA